MSTVEEATRCIQELNGIVSLSPLPSTPNLTRSQDLNGRNIRVDYSVTDRPHAPTPGEYMGHRRAPRDSYRDRDRDRDYRRSDRDRDPYGRDRDRENWRERRSPPPSRGGRYSPDYNRRRRSFSRSPPRGNSPRRDYDVPEGGGSRW